MMWMSFKRVVGSGTKYFVRSGAISFATVLIMTVTLGIIGALVFLSAILTHTLAAIENKVDVNVYFVTSAPEDSIMSLAEKIQGLPEVSSVAYTSREDALAAFRARHEGDELTLQALNELGDNPLGARLAIKAKDTAEYAGIVQFLEDSPMLTSDGSPIIDHVNYEQNKTVIDRLTAAIAATERAGIIIVILFAIASVTIALASMRLAIYNARDEIAVMRLVGASNWYIRGPFIIAGIISGTLAAFIALLIFYPATWYAGSSLESWLGGFNLFSYYLSHFPAIFLLLIGSGVVLGGIASYLGLRRYLTI